MGDKEAKDVKKKVAARKGSNAGTAQGDEAKCGDCGKAVTEKEKDPGIQCEICSEWFHCKCANIPEESRGLLELETIHWFCDHCNKGMGKVLQWLTKLEARCDSLDCEVAEMKTTIANIAAGVQNNETGMKQTRDRVEKLAKEIDSRLKHIQEKVSHKEVDEALVRVKKEINEEAQKKYEDYVRKYREEIKGTDEKVEKLVEEKVKKVEEKVSTQNQKVTDLKKEIITTTDEKIDSLFKQKLTENMIEEQERKFRQNNVIVFGIEESKHTDKEVRIADDVDAMKDILASIQTSEAEMKQLIRLGKRPEEGTDAKPRPLKVVFQSESAKKEVLEKAKKLRSTKNCQIFIVQDMTPKERQRRKELVAERDYRKSQGEDVIIYMDKVVVRRKRTDEN